MKYVMYMHGGSGNHGCEAIVRTTAQLLGDRANTVLWSQAKHEDLCYGAGDLMGRVVVSEELRRFSPGYWEGQLRRRLLGQSDANLKIFLREQFRGNIALSVGGDNYCYPWSADQVVMLNRQIRRHARATVLWGCSVEESALTPQIREDLAGYDLITARESISYALLKAINPNTIQVADPAFTLGKVERPLPEGFAPDNTVGINVSPLILGYGPSVQRILNNYEHLLREILEHTDMHICLIPHVIWQQTDDREPCRLLYEAFRHTGRVCMAADGNALELKGDIARCRFFVGARTHATIAAYSSLVPTLVAGYSVKARGIARDLFGTEDGYVIPVQQLESDDELARGFRWLAEHEQAIRTRLEAVMPDYTARAYLGKAALERLRGSHYVKT